MSQDLLEAAKKGLHLGVTLLVAFSILVGGGLLVLQLLGVKLPGPANPGPSQAVTSLPYPPTHSEPTPVAQSPPVASSPVVNSAPQPASSAPANGISLPQIPKVIGVGVIFVIIGVLMAMSLEVKGGLIGMGIGLVLIIIGGYL